MKVSSRMGRVTTQKKTDSSNKQSLEANNSWSLAWIDAPDTNMIKNISQKHLFSVLKMLCNEGCGCQWEV